MDKDYDILSLFSIITFRMMSKFLYRIYNILYEYVWHSELQDGCIETVTTCGAVVLDILNNSLNDIEDTSEKGKACMSSLSSLRTLSLNVIECP